MKELEEMKKAFDEFMAKAEQTLTRMKGKQEILDKEEKEYLEAVIRPFKDRVSFISKYSCVEGYEYICIHIKDDTFTTLPDFELGTMYKGMELDKIYFLDELGLFKEE